MGWLSPATKRADGEEPSLRSCCCKRHLPKASVARLGSRGDRPKCRGRLRCGGGGGRRSRRCALFWLGVASELEWRERIARWDGSETTVVAPESAAGVRVFAVPGSKRWLRYGTAATEDAFPGTLRFTTTSAGGMASACPSGRMRRSRIGWLASIVTVGGIVQAVERGDQRRNRRGPGEPGRWRNRRRWPRPMARAYPILQGPMTRVSDVPGFAEAVARGGGSTVSGPGAASRAGSPSALAGIGPAARGTAVGRGHPGLCAS